MRLIACDRGRLHGLFSQRLGAHKGQTFPTGLQAVDAVLPEGGLPRGAVHEILSEPPEAGRASPFSKSFFFAMLLARGADRILMQITQSLRRWRLTARAAIAPTPGAAWALAQYAAPGRLAAQCLDDLPKVLSPLPVGGLRLDRDCVRALHHLGIIIIQQLLALPRSQLPARFGDQLLLRLDQTLGRISEPLDFLPYQPPIQAHQDFDFAICGPELLRAVLEKLIANIAIDLTQTG